MIMSPVDYLTDPSQTQIPSPWSTMQRSQGTTLAAANQTWNHATAWNGATTGTPMSGGFPNSNPSAKSYGTSPFSQPAFQFGLGSGPGLISLSGGGYIFDQSDSNPNSAGSKFGSQNANSAYIKFGSSDPAANQAARTSVTPEAWAKVMAGGGNLVWSSANGGQWLAQGGNYNEVSRNGPNYGSSPLYSGQVQAYQDRYQQALAYLNNLATQPVGTPALRQLNAMRK